MSKQTNYQSTIKYQLITDSSVLEDVIYCCFNSNIVGLDTETTGLDVFSDRIRLLQLAVPNQPIFIIDLDKVESTESLHRMLGDRSLTKIFHNGKFDLKMLLLAGFWVSGPFFDTMLASQLLTNGLEIPNKLSDLSERYLGQTLSKEQQTSNWSSRELSSLQLEYAARDAAILLPLYSVLNQKLETSSLLEVAELEFNCLPALVEIELNGMKLDIEKWQKLKDSQEEIVNGLETKLQSILAPKGQYPLFPELSGSINLNSPEQVLAAFQELGIEATSTNATHLASFASSHPVVVTLLKYRQTAKSLSTYITKLPKLIHPSTGRLHPEYHQLGAATGRMSCSNPPLQQIPRAKEFRCCFVPEEGYCLIKADFSQIELRAIAKFAGEPTMTAAYMRGDDLHRLTASFVLGILIESVTPEQRRIAKSINFGLAFGMGAKRYIEYARSYYELTFTLYQANQFRKKFFKLYPGLTAWHENVKLERMASDRTLSGRRRLWPGQPPFTELVNLPIQGIAADILKLSLGMILEALGGTGAFPIGTVHDEIILECPIDSAPIVAKILTDCMVQAGNRYLYPIPVEVETKIITNWAGN